MAGEGMVVLDWAFCIGALVAGLCQLAVLRTPDIRESFLLEGTRRIRIVAWMILFVRSLYVLVNFGDFMVPIYSLVPLLMLAWADSISAVARLFRDKAHPLLKTNQNDMGAA